MIKRKLEICLFLSFTGGSMDVQRDVVEKLCAVISKLDIDIVVLADSAGLGSFIPDNLRQWRDSDFWYGLNVRSFLEKAIELIQTIEKLIKMKPEPPRNLTDEVRRKLLQTTG